MDEVADILSDGLDFICFEIFRICEIFQFSEISVKLFLRVIARDSRISIIDKFDELTFNTKVIFSLFFAKLGNVE